MQYRIQFTSKRMLSTFSHSPYWKLYPVTPSLTVPSYINKPPYALGESVPNLMGNNSIEIKTEQEQRALKQACEAASYIREFAGKQVQEGITTDEIDRYVHNECIRINVYPSPQKYQNFPKSVCTSVNSVVCHGIPDLRPLQDGDIINIDVSVYVNGYHGDCSQMFVVGKPKEQHINLIKATREALHKAIEVCKPDTPFSAIGNAIQEVADLYQQTTVKEFVGHGIGRHMHMPPQILHYRNTYPGIMKAGMTFTIEPILLDTNKEENLICLSDGWTIITENGSYSAQVEEVIAITPDGYKILTTH